MTANKSKQHYIPRFHLRNFNYGADYISLYNLLNDLYIPCASIKDQAYRKHFYDNDGSIEEALSIEECTWAKLVAHIIASESLPDHLTYEHIKLLQLMSVTESRTKRKAEIAQQGLQFLVDTLLEKNCLKDPNDASLVTAEWKDAPLLNVRTAYLSVPILFDLRLILLLNRTNREFITSDNPVILTNKLVSLQPFASHSGWACRGIVALLAISPNCMVVLYDSNVYACSAHRTRRTILLNNPDIIDDLNSAQVVKADENIYYSRKVSSEYIQQLVQQYGDLRISYRPSISTYVDKLDCNHEVWEHKYYPAFDFMSLSFLRIMKHIKTEYKSKSEIKAVDYRDSKLIEKHEHIIGKVLSGKIDFSQMQDEYLRLVELEQLEQDLGLDSVESLQERTFSFTKKKLL